MSYGISEPQVLKLLGEEDRHLEGADIEQSGSFVIEPQMKWAGPRLSWRVLVQARIYRSADSHRPRMNTCSVNSASIDGTVAAFSRYTPARPMEVAMKKVSIVLAALATIAVALPSIASAQEIGVRIGSDRVFHGERGEFREHGAYRGARAEYRLREDRGWHRGWDRDRSSDRVVIIKKHRHHYWD